MHLIIQFPVLNTSGISDPASLASRQKEYIYCLQRNLLSPEVSPGHLRVVPSLCFKMRLSVYSRANKTHFHKEGFARSFVLKERVFGTRKWAIVI